MFFGFVFSFSGLFGSTTKEASPKRSVTTTSNVKQSITTDQIAPQNTEKFEIEFLD